MARTASFTVPVRVSPGVVVFLSRPAGALQDLGGPHGHHDPADHHSDHSAHWRRRILRPRSLVLTNEKAPARTGAERTWGYVPGADSGHRGHQVKQSPFQCRVPHYLKSAASCWQQRRRDYCCVPPVRRASRRSVRPVRRSSRRSWRPVRRSCRRVIPVVWASASETVSVAVGTARANPNPRTDSSFRREIVSDVMWSLMYNLP